MADVLSSPPDTTGTPPAARRAAMLVVLLSAMFMAQFDFFVVNVAAPSLERDLHTGPEALELIAGGYAFAYAAGMITGGRLGDRFGHRRLFITGMAAFTLTSLLCGITTGPWQLVAARLGQGLAGALMVPQVLAVITADFPAEMRSRGVAGYGIAGGLGSIAGQVLGGALLQADVAGLGWRLIFLLNVPVGIVCTIWAFRVLPVSRPRHTSRLDPLGAIGISSALALALVPLILGRTSHWAPWTWICMAAAVPVAALTLWWQRTLTDRDGSPMLDLSLFRSPSFRAGVIASTAFFLYFASFMFTLTLFLQTGRGLGPLGAGLAFSPMGVLYAATSFIGGRLTARHGMKALVAGSGVTALGLFLLAAGLHIAGGGAGLPWVVCCLCLVGAGNGVVLPSLVRCALMDVEPAKAGAASGALTTAQQFAGAAGVAVIGTMFSAIAGARHAGQAYPAAMAWAATADFVFVLTVMWMTWKFEQMATAVSG